MAKSIEYKRFEKNLATIKHACGSLSGFWAVPLEKEEIRVSECGTLLQGDKRVHGVARASVSQLQLLDASQKESNSILKALKVDYALGSGGFFVRGVRYNVFGAENWSRVITEWRKGNTIFVGSLLQMAPDLALIREVIPESMDRELLRKQPEDKGTHTVVIDTLYLDQKTKSQTLPILRQMNADIFEFEISRISETGFLPLHFGIHFAQLCDVPLDFDYLKLLVPKQLAEICGGYCLRAHHSFLSDFVTWTFRNKSTQQQMQAIAEVSKLLEFASSFWKECPEPRAFVGVLDTNSTNVVSLWLTSQIYGPPAERL